MQGGFPSVYLSVMRKQKRKHKSFVGKPTFIGPKGTTCSKGTRGWCLGLDEILSAYGNLSKAFKPLARIPVANNESDVCLEDELISAFAFHSGKLDSTVGRWSGRSFYPRDQEGGNRDH